MTATRGAAMLGALVLLLGAAPAYGRRAPTSRPAASRPAASRPAASRPAASRPADARGTQPHVSAAKRPLFALVIGVNQAPRPSVAPLRYADDDAVLFHRLLSRLGRSVLLTRLDAATARLYPDLRRRAPARATRANVERALTKLLAEVAAARARGAEPRLLFVYSGHGDVKNGEGYLALDGGARLTGGDIERMLLARSRASENHLLVDACRSYYLVRAKRAGGSRVAVQPGFHRPAGFLARYPNTGVLLSTSSAASSHEWDALQAGVFSHEVRSGLLGGADADGDGRVSYDELATFLVVANAAIPNQRFRPRFYARGPRGRGGAELLDLRSFRGERLVIPPRARGRYLLEDARGVRLADVHSSGSRSLVLRLPATGTMFLRRVRTITAPGDSSALEHRVLARGEPRTLSLPPARPTRYRPKGAAHESFRRIFERPFSRGVMLAYRGCLRRDARCGGGPCPPCPCATCKLWERPPPTALADAPGAVVRRRTRRGDAPLASVALGLRVMSRTLVGEGGLAPQRRETRRIRYGATLMVGSRLAVHPLAQSPVPGLSWLGLTASYYHSVALDADVSAPGQSAASSDAGRVQLYDFGLRLRVPLGSRLLLVYAARVGGEHSEIETAAAGREHWNRIHFSPADVALRVRVLTLGRLHLRVHAAAAYTYYSAADELPLGASDSGVNALSGGHGVGLRGGLSLRWRFVTARLGAFYSHSVTDLDRDTCPAAACSTPRIRDTRAGGELFVGVRY